MNALDELGWPLERSGEALQMLAAFAGLAAPARELPPAPARLDPAALARFVEDSAEWLQLEAEPIDVGYGELAATLERAAPALLVDPRQPAQPRLWLLAAGGKRPLLIGPDGEPRRVDGCELRACLLQPLEVPLAPNIGRLLDRAQVAPRRRARIGRTLLRDRLGGSRVAAGFILRERVTHDFAGAARRARVPAAIATLLSTHLVAYLLYVGSWALLGKGALDGRIDRGWLVAWLLLLLSSLPFRLLATRAAGELSLRLGALIKARLLAGALALDPDETRRDGAGALLGRVLESAAVEQLAIGGGLDALMATLELLVAAAVLTLGAVGWLGALALLAWLALTAALLVRNGRAQARWTDERLTLTRDLVERMVGHRTRLMQEEPGRWHEGEDQALARYLEHSRALDRRAVAASAWAPRGLLVVGIAALGPAFVAGGAPTLLAVGLGGLLLAYRALRRFVAGAGELTAAAIAWRSVAPLFAAAARQTHAPTPLFALPDAPVPAGATLIEADRLVFRYGDRGVPVLRGCSVELHAGDRLLIEGPSGGGKSTLGALLAGLRAADGGLLLLGGLDRHTLGLDGWRRRVVAAPQFHENHVFVGTLSFNLLFGRAWPPSGDDLADAWNICRELGLGALLERMPSGMEQMVGEIGWQLSHGERSRVYVARALLQRSEVVILDESFAALDPQTLQVVMDCVLRRARTLVVIAHP